MMPTASPKSETRTIHVGQGEYHIDDDAQVMIAAILGSCVAACLHDPVRKIGGMNHILLPSSGSDSVASSAFAVNAMELLINGMLREGADKRRIEAKLFGGASMVSGLAGDIGRRNAEVTKAFLEAEGIRCLSESLGGTQGRKVQFWPHTGRARQMVIGHARDVEPPPPPAPKPEDSGALELF